MTQHFFNDIIVPIDLRVEEHKKPLRIYKNIKINNILQFLSTVFLLKTKNMSAKIKNS